MRRVVVTGLGVVAPNGIGTETFWENLVAGVTGIDRITRFDARHADSRRAGQIAMRYGFAGPNNVEGTACAIRDHDDGAAVEVTTREAGHVVIAGGSEA